MTTRIGRPQAPERLELGQRQQRAAVAQRRHRQAVGPGDRRPDGVAEREADALEGLREDEAGRVGHAQVHRRPAHEGAGVHDDGALGRQQVVERDAQRARVEYAGGPALGVGLVAPAPRGDLAPPARACGARRRSAPRRASAASSASAVAAASPITPSARAGGRRSPPRRGRPARRPRRAPAASPWPRRPLVQRGAEGDDHVGLPQQPRGQRRREAAGDAQVVRVAGEQPVGHGARGQQRAGALAERAQRRAGAREHGAAAGDDGRALRAGQQVGERGRRPPAAGRGGGERAGRRRRPARRRGTAPPARRAAA